MFSVNFYREEDGSKPVGDFIQGLNVKMKAKVVSDLHRPEMPENEAGSPLSKFLEDDIFELRAGLGNNIVRILYFFDGGEIIVVTNGFVKNSRKHQGMKSSLPNKEELLILSEGRIKYE